MSAVYDAAYRSRPDLFGTSPDDILERLVEQQNISGRALDLGCGDGRNSVFLAQHGLQVLSLDTSRAGVVRLSELARRHGLPIVAEVGDVREFSADPGTFDLVIADTVLCHLGWDDVVDVAGRMERIVRPGGWLYASVFTTDDPRQSEFAEIIRSYFDPGAFCGLFSGLDIQQCEHERVTDTSHGPVHEHDIVWVVARREE